MKLGFIYTVTSGGFDDQKVRINPDGWSNVIEDERQLWLKYNSANECVAMTFVKNGVVFAISRIIGGSRADNNICTWVYIPSKIIISGAEIIKIIDTVKEINKNGTKKITENTFIDNAILNQDFPEKANGISFNASTGKEYALRFPTNDFTFAEILNFPFQSYYIKYKYIFLYDNVPPQNLNIKNLSNEDIVEYISVYPPSVHTINEIFGTGTVLKYSNGKVANKPIIVKKGETIDLTVEKPGYISRRIKGKAERDGGHIKIVAYEETWRRIINDSYFNIVDSKTGEKIKSPGWRIYGPGWENSNIFLPEDKLKDAKVTISAEGYKSFTANVDLRYPPVRIPLTKEEEKNYLILPDTPGDVDIPKGGNKKFNKQWFLIGFLIPLLLGAVVWCGILLYKRVFPSFNTKENSEKAENSSGDSDQETVDLFSLENAINYLQSNEKWEKDSLDKYPDLKGLFEELNNYNFEAIKNRSDKLKSSDRYNELIEAIETNNSKNLGGNFNNENDYIITVPRYIRRLNSANNGDNGNNGNTGNKEVAEKGNSTVTTTSPKQTNTEQSTSKKTETTNPKEETLDPGN